MIIYEAQISEFPDDVSNEVIVDRLYNVYQEKIGLTSRSEIHSWDHSLQRMSNVLREAHSSQALRYSLIYGG